MKPINIREVEQTQDFVMNYFSNSIGSTDAVVSIMHATVKPLSSTERDEHKVKEYWFVTHGSGELTINDSEKVTIKKGQLYFFDSFVSHQLYNPATSENIELLSIWW
ncbi:MAG: cupin domain-containing protein [Chryseotalea sp.]